MDDLIRKIEAGDASVVEELRALPSRCVHDDQLTTPFAAAIRAGNEAVLTALLEDPEALEYRPDLPEDVVSQMKLMAGGGVGTTTEAVEAQLLGYGFMPVPYFQRTPLLEACRWGNADAVAALVARGASPKEKDALGMDALDLALATGDEAVVEALVRGAAEAGTPVPVGAAR